MEDLKYCCIIITYKPNIESLIKNIDFLSNAITVYIIDSSPSKEFENIIFLNTMYNNDKIKLFHIANLGAAYSINTGIRKAIEDGFNLFSIFDDDVFFLSSKFDSVSIVNYFKYHCNPDTDMLYLTSNPSKFAKNPIRVVESGMTFSSKLFTKIQFREEFVMDQLDFEFCDQIYKLGGLIKIFPVPVIDNLPVGRVTNQLFHSVPSWRLYTITRNALRLSLENGMNVKSLLLWIHEVTHWFTLCVLSGQSLFECIRNILLGIIDGIQGKLGITPNLLKVSNNRFDNINLKVMK
ncbi:MAG: hypothetical protein QXP36_10665 [Conexivisphaerales archaeon]